MNNNNGLLAVLVVIVFVLAGHDVARAENNQMIKDCLQVWGYNYTEKDVEKRLNNFPWNKASGCVSNFVVAEHKKRIEKDRQFINDNPWFKGTNWKWQGKAEYTCTKQYHTGLTVCQKPYYLN